MVKARKVPTAKKTHHLSPASGSHPALFAQASMPVLEQVCHSTETLPPNPPPKKNLNQLQDRHRSN